MTGNTETPSQFGALTAEELIAVSDYVVTGEIKEYQTTELKAAAQRLGNFLATLKDEDRELDPGLKHLGEVVLSTKHELERPQPIDPFEDRAEYQRHMEQYQDFIGNVGQTNITVKNSDIRS